MYTSWLVEEMCLCHCQLDMASLCVIPPCHWYSEGAKQVNSFSCVTYECIDEGSGGCYYKYGGFGDKCYRYTPSVMMKIELGEFQMIFISPEALFCGTVWRRLLCTDIYRKNLVAFVVDEAHCIKNE